MASAATVVFPVLCVVLISIISLNMLRARASLVVSVSVCETAPLNVKRNKIKGMYFFMVVGNGTSFKIRIVWVNGNPFIRIYTESFYDPHDSKFTFDKYR